VKAGVEVSVLKKTAVGVTLKAAVDGESVEGTGVEATHIVPTAPAIPESA
jgi:hypothetical protein